jgi:hypothetical protein
LQIANVTGSVQGGHAQQSMFHVDPFTMHQQHHAQHFFKGSHITRVNASTSCKQQCVSGLLAVFMVVERLLYQHAVCYMLHTPKGAVGCNHIPHCMAQSEAYKQSHRP